MTEDLHTAWQCERDEHPGEQLWAWIHRMGWERHDALVEVNRLRAIIAAAPHMEACSIGQTALCTCWKGCVGV